MQTQDPFTDRLSDYLDGELPVAQRRAVDAHLQTCAACRAVLDELRAVVASARQVEDRGPDADLWSGIAGRLGPRARRAGFLAGLRAAARHRISFTLPQLAAAALALVVLSGGLVWFARSGNPRADFPPVSADASLGTDALRPANFGDPEFDRAIADLERTLAEGRGTLDAGTIAVIETNLRAIDDAIAQSRRALAADPGNTYLNSHLARARQRKLALLRRATGLAAAGG